MNKYYGSLPIVLMQNGYHIITGTHRYDQYIRIYKHGDFCGRVDRMCGDSYWHWQYKPVSEIVDIVNEYNKLESLKNE